MSGKTAKVLFNFEARKKEELSLTKGETIDNIEKLSADWLRGTAADGATGCFPANYVVVIDPAAVKKKVIAKYDFEGKGDKISFKKGENIDVLVEVSSEWWTGINKAGETGLFPSNYVTDEVKGSVALGGTKRFTREDIAAAQKQKRPEEVFTSATLKDFPLTFAMPRKAIPKLKNKYQADETSDEKKKREEALKKLQELEGTL